jgi:hypothetical protein
MPHKSHDLLITQVSLTIKAPPDVKISKRVLKKLVAKLVAGEELPKNVTVRGIFWRNPNRHGKLGAWRYHEGADLSVAPTPRESAPRGSLQDAIDTLSPFLQEGSIEF